MEAHTAEADYDKKIAVLLDYGVYMNAAQKNSENGNLYIAAEQSRTAAREARNIGDGELVTQAATEAFQRFLTAAQYPSQFIQSRGTYLQPATREDCLREALFTAQEFGLGEASQLERIKNSLVQKVS